MRHLVSPDGSWSVLDRTSPETRVLIERNGERIDLSEWQSYKSFCKDLARVGSVEAIRLLQNTLSIVAGADCEADDFIDHPDFALFLRGSFVLRAGWLDRLEDDVSEWLEYEKRSEYRQHADRGLDAITRLRKLFRFAHRGRRGKGCVHQDDRELW